MTTGGHIGPSEKVTGHGELFFGGGIHYYRWRSLRGGGTFAITTTTIIRSSHPGHDQESNDDETTTTQQPEPECPIRWWSRGSCCRGGVGTVRWCGSSVSGSGSSSGSSGGSDWNISVTVVVRMVDDEFGGRRDAVKGRGGRTVGNHQQRGFFFIVVVVVVTHNLGNHFTPTLIWRVRHASIDR